MNGETKRPLRRRLLGALIFALWCVVVVEALLWGASLASTRVDLLLTNRQGVPKRLPDEETGHMRNPEYAENDSRGFRNEKALDSAEIVTLGDSQTAGLNARSEEAWPKQLQRMLSTPVYNMAVGGFGPGRYHYLVDQALELHPRWVITGFYIGNDLWNVVNEYYILDVPGIDWRPKDPARVQLVQAHAKRGEEEYLEAARYLTYQPPSGARKGKGSGSRERRGMSPVRLLQDHSRIWGAARAIKAGIQVRFFGRRPSQPFDRRHWEQLVEAARTDPGLVVYQSAKVRTVLHPGHRFNGEDIEGDSLVAEGLDMSLHMLRRIDERVRAAGSRHLILLIPSKEYIYHDALDPEPLPGTLQEALARNEAAIVSRATEFFEENGIEYVDALPEMRRAVAEEVQLYPYSTQSHPDSPGYERIARAAARALEERGFAAGGP